ncbi:hypothetical protein KNV79_gp25 [Salmonella phage vB_SalP_TR2]|uniref:Uncharacterized protein n=1 Tax=Salmonella phage vB_SalP_TR2 TaxID=2812854 RepID=A0A898K8Z3_9CAUD|nr:hypothetical protein KNV79_gp25 [Salmonella phage vB_SalP_TR2]QSJ04001.1 hypothetical protein [Salmonella phage vB_SalP_TR2]
MNDQLQKVLADIITRVTSGADAAIQFGKEQIPEVLKQLLIWNFTFSFLIWFSATAIIVGYIIWMLTKFRWWFKNQRSTTTEQDAAVIALTVIWGIITFIMIFVFWCNLDWLKIWVAPKLYLLEYAASLIKSST